MEIITFKNISVFLGIISIIAILFGLLSIFIFVFPILFGIEILSYGIALRILSNRLKRKERWVLTCGIIYFLILIIFSLIRNLVYGFLFREELILEGGNIIAAIIGLIITLLLLLSFKKLLKSEDLENKISRSHLIFFLIAATLSLGLSFYENITDLINLHQTGKRTDDIDILVTEKRCDEALSSHVRNDCYHKLAVAEKDILYCEKIEYSSFTTSRPSSLEIRLKNRCYLDLAKLKKDSSICDKIIIDLYDGFSMQPDDCYSDLALFLKDITICDKIKTNIKIDQCYRRLAMDLKDKSLCEKIKIKSERDECYSALAVTLEDETADWQTYRNERYLYGFKYPEGAAISSNEYATDNKKAYNISVITAPARPTFNVEVIDPEYFRDSIISDTANLELEEYVKKIHQMNKEDINPYILDKKKVGDILLITVGDESGYQFLLEGSYIDEKINYVLKQEHLYVFLSKNNKKYIIWFPADNEQSKKILSTFRFLE